MLVLFSEVKTLQEKSCRTFLTHPVKTQISAFLPLLSVGSCCKAFKFPVVKALKVKKGISARDCRQIHRQHMTIYSPCFCLLFFSPGSVMQIYKSPFVRFPAECNIFCGWSSHLDDCHTPAHKNTDIHNNSSAISASSLSVMYCDDIRECSSLIKMSHNRATIHCHTMSPWVS